MALSRLGSSRSVRAAHATGSSSLSEVAPLQQVALTPSGILRFWLVTAIVVQLAMVLADVGYARRSRDPPRLTPALRTLGP